MALYRFASAALTMAVVCLAAPVTEADQPCATTLPPFGKAVCRNIAKPDGTEAALFLSRHFTPASPPEQSGRTTAGFCHVDGTIFSGKSANPDAPLAADCEVLGTWLDANPGAWSVSKADSLQDKWTAFAALDSCAFAAMSADNSDTMTAGADDVARLVEASLARHRIADRLDVLGRTTCEALTVDWRIARPGTLDMGN